jgi:putative transposase
VRTPDRLNRERDWETRVGRIGLAILKLRKRYFPSFLEPRRAKKALTA